MTRHRRLAVVLGLLVLVGVLGPTTGRDESRAASPRVVGTLRLSAEVTAPGSSVRVRGWVAPHVRRPVVVQRSLDGSTWRRVAAGSSSRRGHYGVTSPVPDVASTRVRYRVLLPRHVVRGRVLPRAVTPTASIRTTDPLTDPSQPTPTVGSTPTRPPATSPPPTEPTAPTDPTGTTVPTGPTGTTTPSPSTTPLPPPSGPTDAPLGPVVAVWTMDEPSGSTVMVDTSGRGHHGDISSDAAAAGLELTGDDYEWSDRCRDCPPTSLPRVVQVPDSPDLEIPDDDVRWALELRFRTTNAYGNLMQKGQATTAGGQIKVEDPVALTCVFKGAGGDHALVRSPEPLDDGQWHTVTCVHTATSVSQWVDGVLVARTRRATGPIDNREPFVIGGKILCDQDRVGCDYYSGLVDWARITRG